jgi:hypothetical protein
MRQLAAATFVLAIVGVAALARAEDKPSPTGTWKWTVKMGDQSREMTLNLKLEGDKLTGSMPGRDGKETPIAESKYKDGELSFTITRERNGQKMTTKYAGKVSGDTIKGQVEFTREGQAQKRDWEAKRAKD